MASKEEEEFLAQWLAENGMATPAATEEVAEEETTESDGEMSEEEKFLAEWNAANNAPSGAETTNRFERQSREDRQRERNRRSKDGAFDRAKGSLQMGLSDAISTLAGDVYNEEGEKQDMPLTAFPIALGEDGLEFNNPLDFENNRLLKATAQGIRGAGGAVGEIVGAADEALGGPLQAIGESYAETKAEHPIYSEAGLDTALRDLEETVGPGITDTVKDATTVAAAALPYSTSALKSTRFANRVDDLPDAAKRQRRDQIQERWKPKRPVSDPQYDVEFTGGVTDRRRSTPKADSFRAQMIDDLDGIEDLNPRDAAGKNFLRIDSEADKLRRDLDTDLRMKGDPINYQRVTDDIEDMLEQSKDVPSLSDPAAQGAFDRTITHFNKILEQYTDGTEIAPVHLLQARRDLDVWLHTKSGDLVDPTARSGQALAIKELRQKINNIVNEAVDDVDVAESLRKQHSLLTARDEIRDLADFEGGNRFTRALQETQAQSGLTLPHSPAAVGANLQPGALAVGTALLGYNRLGHGARRLGRNAYARGGATAEGAYNVGMGAIPSAAMTDEERQRMLSEYIRRPQ